MDWIVRWVGATATLDRWITRDFSPAVEQGPRPGDRRDAHERVVAWEAVGPPEPGGVCRRLAAAVTAFDIFPPGLLTALPEHRPLRRGDTVALQCRFLPGLDVVFAARVVATFDGASDGIWRSGLTYRTLRGHPFCGEETFSVEKELATGAITVALRSWSRPALWTVRLGQHIARRNQLGAGRAALDHLESLHVPARRDLRTRLLRCGEQ